MAGTLEKPLKTLLDYCAKNEIIINTDIEPKRIPGRGLGVYSKKEVAAGQQLVHVPTNHIFTTDSIPGSFLGNTARKDIAVHAQLAAFFAFGSKADLKPYQPWLATWPPLEDFTDMMPMFWGEAIADEIKGASAASKAEPVSNRSNHPTKRRKISNEPERFPVSHIILGKRKCKPREAAFSLSPAVKGTSGMANEMVKKLTSHILSISSALPHLDIISHDEDLLKFLHAWCQVNTRCFYYIPIPQRSSTSGKRASSKAKIRPPSDPNEAMALCPFMDLFNHRAPPPDLISSASALSDSSSTNPLPCSVKCDATGFKVATRSTIPADTEVLFSYGDHTNDTLWTEYGFILPDDTNTSDSIPIDEFVLRHMDKKQRKVLEEKGYLGSYTLHKDGTLCYRTEMAIWLVVLGEKLWSKVVDEGLDPEVVAQNRDEIDRPKSRKPWTKLDSAFGYRMGILTASIVGVAGNSIEALQAMKDEDLLDHFNTLSVVEKLCPNSEEDRIALAKRRRDMVVSRWEQVLEMVRQCVEKFQRDNVG